MKNAIIETMPEKTSPDAHSTSNIPKRRRTPDTVNVPNINKNSPKNCSIENEVHERDHSVLTSFLRLLSA
ncbi:hypothetical protein, partial [Halorubrum glutamatedens]